LYPSKRALDIGLSLAALLIVTPILAVVLVAIRCESAGPPLLVQTRVGREGRPFACLKLRTMYYGTAHLPTHQTPISAVTPLGARLRRWKLDELPQLVNVFLGQMSLVGPRPCLPAQTALIEARRRLGVLSASPGITGLAQVQNVDMSDPERLARIDAEYVRTRSFSLDLKLIMATLLGKGVGIDHIADGA
jgi:O-antigen biosynthesis protein WbqP